MVSAPHSHYFSLSTTHYRSREGKKESLLRPIFIPLPLLYSHSAASPPPPSPLRRDSACSLFSLAKLHMLKAAKNSPRAFPPQARAGPLAVTYFLRICDRASNFPPPAKVPTAHAPLHCTAKVCSPPAGTPILSSSFGRNPQLTVLLPLVTSTAQVATGTSGT